MASCGRSSFSLARLGLNRTDVLYVLDLESAALRASTGGHLPTFLNGVYKALDELKSAGSIATWGLGSHEVPAIVAVMRRVPIDVMLLAGRFTLLDRTAAVELMPLCVEHGVGVVIGGVFNFGILATGPV